MMKRCRSECSGRRQFLKNSAALLTGGLLTGRTVSASVPAAAGGISSRPRRVAGVITVWYRNSHADVLLSRILEGWNCDGGPGPNLTLTSLYVDQFPDSDLAVKKAQQFGFPICESIEEALTAGQDRIAVDGVISIGEHGDYPWNSLGQHLYPRRRFFEQITAAFEKHGTVVPVFSDKHPGPVWDDAWWMYERSRQLRIPFMAGSSLPVSYRSPDFTLPMESDLEAALAIGYAGLDVYGFHTLDFLQSIIERRRCAHQGVDWVQWQPGSRLKQLTDEGIVRKDLLDALLDRTPSQDGSLWDADPKDFHIFLIRYRSGLLVPVLMLTGYARAISVMVKVRGQTPVGGIAEERTEPRFPHFSFLLRGIEQMIHTGQPSWPVERTVLTAGILDRLLRSKASGGKQRQTPELAIDYRPVDYPHAPHLSLTGPFVQ